MVTQPTLLSRVVKWAILRLYRWKGWQLDGPAPTEPKYVILGAPHTSNWDFVFFVGATHELGVRPRFLGKTSLFRWPLTRFMRDMGGVPIDRSARHNYVDQVVAAFAAEDEFRLVIAPEGTRGGDGRWRSGFYHIASGAGVPVVPAWVDNQTMRGGLGPAIALTGDYQADLARIATFFAIKLPGHPKLAGLHAMVKEGDA